MFHNRFFTIAKAMATALVLGVAPVFSSTTSLILAGLT